MCFGFDTTTPALRAAEAGTGPDRRALLRGLGVTALAGGTVALAGAPAAAAERRPVTSRGRGRRVPPGQISIQMYTLRSITNAGTVASVLATLSDQGYRQVELAGTYGYSADALRGVLSDAGIVAGSSHDGISGDEASMHAKFENAVTLGQRFVNVPYLYSESAAQWHAWAEQMNAEAAVARSYGLQYGYHNHAHEFSVTLDDGSTAWEVFTADLDPATVHLEVDLFWAVTGGLQTGEATEATASQFAIDVIASAPQETKQYHVKDREAGLAPFAGNAFADVGTGFLDFPAIFEAHPVAQYIVENDQPDVTPQQSAAVGFSYLRSARF